MRKVDAEPPRLLTGVRTRKRTIGESVWGRAWGRHLERHGDFANRLPRGRSYLRNGSVLHLSIGPGRVDGVVQGRRVYEQSIRIRPLDPEGIEQLVDLCAGHVGAALELVRGQLPKPLLATLQNPSSGLLPDPGQMEPSCSCPDWAKVCKHVAAVLYGVALRLDAEPELLFVLRGVHPDKLVRGVSAAVAAPAAPAAEGRRFKRLEAQNLGALFDIELEPSASEEEGEAVPEPSDPEPPPDGPPTLRRAELLSLGVASGRIEGWLRSGTLLRTSIRGTYALTEEAFVAIEPLLDP